VFHATGFPTDSTVECGTIELKMAIAPCNDAIRKN